MKIYSYISALLIAGIASFSSCSQEEDVKEMNGDNSSSGLQISVSDGGYFDTTPGTRAIEKGYATEFTEGDEIGIFGVDANGIVENINNRKCMMTADGNWKIDGEQIKYNGAEFKQMKFYAYYPYDVNVKFNVTEGDPFAEYISEWTLGNDQSGEKYTKYDLMTSSSSAVVDNRFKGEINFKMQHCMALAVLKMPNLVYNFINSDVTIDDYELPITNASFKLNNKEVTPYYQKSTGAYRFLVKPGEEFKIEGSYTGVKEMTCTATAKLNEGTAKVYTVSDTNKKEYTLSIGDYYCADGSIVSKDIESVPDNVIGIVCYVGNPQPSVTHPQNYTEANDALRRDYAKCKHGLVLALNNAINAKAPVISNADYTVSNQFHQNKDLGITYGDWFSADEEWKSKFDNCNTANSSTVPETRYPAFMGYNNTVLLTMCYEGKGDQKVCNIAYDFINAYRVAVEVPAVATSWYLPSVTCWNQVAKNLGTINGSLNKIAGADQMVSSTINDKKNAGTDHYWSSTQRNGSTQWVHGMGNGNYALTGERAGNRGYFRMMLAF